MNPLETRSRTADQYGAVAQSLHWVTALLVLIAFIYGPGGSEERVYSSAREFGRRIHESLGLCVLTLTVLRLAWRAVDTQPEPPLVARWMGLAAALMKAALYVLLIVVPCTAIIGAWLEGHPLTLLAGVDIQPLLAKSHEAGKTIASIHGWLGDVILWLAGLHALAGIFHHVVLKDNVLAGMLPRRLGLGKRLR